MSSTKDFDNYDYARFFDGVCEALRKTCDDCSYNLDENVLSASISETDVEVSVSAGCRIQVRAELPMLDGENVRASCMEGNAKPNHLVFHEKGGKQHIALQLPMELGQGWDDIVADEITTVIREIDDEISRRRSSV